MLNCDPIILEITANSKVDKCINCIRLLTSDRFGYIFSKVEIQKCKTNEKPQQALCEFNCLVAATGCLTSISIMSVFCIYNT